ncbi:hypothetical protein [Oxobacter pfennigii]|uniref:hypothetical protein n=1 Tax=Oxobacter pfennigii TaxID=36849 RepID=UPI0006D4066F|nr:hypothetical protein [Oxobacter pfennigii]
MNNLISDIIPLKVGRKWVYKPQSTLMSLLGGDVTMEITERNNNIYLLRLSVNNLKTTVIIKSNVDLSVIALGKGHEGSLNDMAEFQEVQNGEILKGPVVTGTEWSNNFGTFKIVNSDYTFKNGTRVIPDCILLHLKDLSNQDNSFCIKRGVGIIHASLYIDNIGRVNIGLKSFN